MTATRTVDKIDKAMCCRTNRMASRITLSHTTCASACMHPRGLPLCDHIPPRASESAPGTWTAGRSQSSSPATPAPLPVRQITRFATATQGPAGSRDLSTGEARQGVVGAHLHELDDFRQVMLDRVVHQLHEPRQKVQQLRSMQAVARPDRPEEGREHLWGARVCVWWSFPVRPP